MAPLHLSLKAICAIIRTKTMITILLPFIFVVFKVPYHMLRDSILLTTL